MMFSPDDLDDLTDADEQRTDDVPRYGSLEIQDGTTVVYDRDEYDAWIRSERAVEIESME